MPLNVFSVDGETNTANIKINVAAGIIVHSAAAGLYTLGEVPVDVVISLPEAAVILRSLEDWYRLCDMSLSGWATGSTYKYVQDDDGTIVDFVLKSPDTEIVSKGKWNRNTKHYTIKARLAPISVTKAVYYRFILMVRETIRVMQG